MKDFLIILLAVIVGMVFGCFIIALMGGADILPLLGAAILVALLCYMIYLLKEQNEELNKRLNKLEKLLAEKAEQ